VVPRSICAGYGFGILDEYITKATHENAKFEDGFNFKLAAISVGFFILGSIFEFSHGKD